MEEVAAYGGLFASALLAATLIPAQSETVLVGLLASGRFEPWLLVLAAGAGNVLGSVVNWAMGRYLLHFRDRRWFPVGGRGLERATGWFRRFGVWSLLLAWLPVVGDPLTLVAGVLRVRFAVFVLLVAVGKVGRYLVLWWAVPAGWS